MLAPGLSVYIALTLCGVEVLELEQTAGTGTNCWKWNNAEIENALPGACVLLYAQALHTVLFGGLVLYQACLGDRSLKLQVLHLGGFTSCSDLGGREGLSQC